MQAVQIGPVPAGERTQFSFDLFLIFAGANIVATTSRSEPQLAQAFLRRPGRPRRRSGSLSCGLDVVIG